jgi:hypothetical protein
MPKSWTNLMQDLTVKTPHCKHQASFTNVRARTHTCSVSWTACSVQYWAKTCTKNVYVFTNCSAGTSVLLWAHIEPWHNVMAVLAVHKKPSLQDHHRIVPSAFGSLMLGCFTGPNWKEVTIRLHLDAHAWGLRNFMQFCHISSHE